MTQTKDDLINIKSKLLSHIESTYEKSKSDEMTAKIEAMNDSEFIEFLKSQGLIGGEKVNSDPNCVFCSMINGNIPTTSIGENPQARFFIGKIFEYKIPIPCILESDIVTSSVCVCASES